MTQTTHDAAIGYAERGWRVIPLHYPVADGDEFVCSCGRPRCHTKYRRPDGSPEAPVGKHPRPKAWQIKATSDVDQVDVWFERDPRNNVGIATGGEARLVVLDIDPKDGGFASLDELLQAHGSLPPTPTVETGSGGRHYYFRAPADVDVRNSASKIGRGLDIRGEGGQVVAPPSMHASGSVYRWAISPDDDALADLPPWLAKLLTKSPSPRAARDDHGDAEVVSGKRNDWLTSKAGVLRRAGFDEAAIVAALRRENRAKCSPPLEDAEVDKIARSVSSYSLGKIPDSPDDWRTELRPRYDRKGNPAGYLPTRRNVGLVLAHDKAWKGRIWLDAARAQVRIGDRPLTDADLVEIADDLDRRFDWSTLAIGTIHEAIGGVAERNRVDVLADWLEGLSWDGEKRLGIWLLDALGVEDDQLTRAYSRRFLIQAVARALRPGCQADSVLILVGDQGAGKSTAFRLLAGDEWFSDTAVDLRSRDRFAQINRAWFYEFAELASFRASRSDSVKAFITSREDVYRPPYARTEIHHKRRVVFVASTNDDEFLADYTGSRRYWPVRIPKGTTLDRAWILDNRDQLWAEAVAAYKAGEFWHLTATEESWRRFEATQYQERDPWTELVAAWAKDRLLPFTTAIVLRDACKVPVDRHDMRAMVRASSILRLLGFYAVDGKATIEGRQVEARVWKLPGTVAPIGGVPELEERHGDDEDDDDEDDDDQVDAWGRR